LGAESTAYAFVRYVVAFLGPPERVQTDKASSYMNQFLAKMCELLGIKHRTSASLQSRSDDLAESMIRRMIALLKSYAHDDASSEQKLPLCELSIRSSPKDRLGLSPFEILFGHQMLIHAPGVYNLAVPLSGERETYYWFVAKVLKRLHDAVRQRKLEIQKEDKASYDRIHKVQEPDWQVGDKVLLRGMRVKPHSDSVVTHRPFHGPLLVKEIIQGDPKVRCAYRLERLDGGRPLRYLVTADKFS